jgi:lysophospholipase L1-like esterase
MSIDLYAGGPGRGAASLLLRNRDEDFPDWSGRDLATHSPGTRLALLATDGGTTSTLLEHQLPRLRALGGPLSLVTLTVGGNDLVRAYGDTPAAREVVRRVRRDVDAALAAVRSLAGQAPVVVATVYDPTDGTGDAEAMGLPRWPDAVALVADLNAALVEAAGEHGCLVADVHARFLGHGLRVGNPAQRDPRPPHRGLWYCGVIEPNAWGAGALRAALWDALG